MRQLPRHLHSPLASRQQRQLLVQRVRPLLQDEQHQQASSQAEELQSGEFSHLFMTITIPYHVQRDWSYLSIKVLR